MPDPGPATPSFDRQALQAAVRGGGRAVALAQVASQLVSLATLAVLMRLLSPGDYGLVGMVLPLLMLLRIFALLGLNVATVQQPSLSQGQMSSLFWLTLSLGSGAALLTAALAPGVARFYGEPRLLPLTVALAGTALAASLGSLHQALLERKLQLARLSACRLAGLLCGSAAGIATALAGGGVWALVVQQYAELLVLALAAWVAEPWRPARPGEGAGASGAVRFGGYYSASSVMYFLAGQLDKVLVGRLLGEHALGLYGQAFHLMLKPVYLVTTPLAGVMLAALARARSDREAEQTLLAGFYRLTALVLMPAGLGLMMVGPQVMELLGGPQWREAGPILAVLSLAILGQGFINITGPIFSAAGRSDRQFHASAAVAAVLAVAYVVGWWLGLRQGEPLLGVAWGYSTAVVGVLLAPLTLYALRTAGHRAAPVLRAVARPAAAAVAMAAVLWAFRQWASPGFVLAAHQQLAVEVVLGGLVYCLAAADGLLWLARGLRR